MMRLVAPVPPDSYIPPPHGIFPYYGLKEDWGDGVEPVVMRLWKSGVYKIMEEDSFMSQKDTSIFSVFVREDSIEIDEQHIYHGKIVDVKERKIYSHDGKLLYSTDIRDRSFGYFDSDGSWLEFKHVTLRRRDAYLDTIKLAKKIMYDKIGRISEEDDFGYSGKGLNKIIYHYSAAGNEIEKLEYGKETPYNPIITGNKLKDPLEREKFYNELNKYEQEMKFGKGDFPLRSREIRRIDSAARIIEIESFLYRQYNSEWHDVITSYDKKWRPISAKYKSFDGRDTSTTITLYLRNKVGLLVNKVQDTDTTDTWTYDKKGNCIKHIRNSSQETWKYDSKNNIIEHDEGFAKNKFMIYYKS